MPVTVIPYGEDPRRPISSTRPVIEVFTYNDEDFPELKTVLPPNQIRAPSAGDDKLIGEICKVVGNTSLPAEEVLVSTSFPKFMELPTEIRELVEEKAMLAGGHLTYDLFIQDHLASNSQRPRFLPALCFVSKALFSETTQVFLRHAKFVISNYAANLFMHEFLNHAQGFSSIRNIALPYFDYFPGVGNTKDGHLCENNSDLALVAKCSGLRIVKITMGVKNLRNWVLKAGNDYEDGLDSVAKTVPEVVKFYDLEKLFACDALRKIHWDGRFHFRIENNTEGDLRGVLHDLASWVQEKFRSKGMEQKDFECVVTWRS